MRQGDRPLVSTRGQLYDHIAFGVADLDAWVAKLRSEGVRFLEEPYTLGDTRAVMIEGPSREEHTSELQSREKLVCRLLLEKKKEHDDDFLWRALEEIHGHVAEVRCVG